MEKNLKKLEEKKTWGGARSNSGKKPFIDRLTKDEMEQVKKAATAEYWGAAFEKIAKPFIFDTVDNPLAPWDVRIKAAQEIINRFLGRPKEFKELSGPDGGPISLQWLDENS